MRPNTTARRRWIFTYLAREEDAALAAKPVSESSSSILVRVRYEVAEKYSLTLTELKEIVELGVARDWPIDGEV